VTDRSRLLMISFWPLFLLLLAAACSVGWELARDTLQHSPRGTGATGRAGLQHVLPLTLVVTFVLVPATATRIFKTFLCEALEVSSIVTRRYLHDDLYLDCDSHEYDMTRTSALVMLAIWPVGTPLLYTVLLWASRDALRSRTPTPLSRATAFLWSDYKLRASWWEPLEMCRKLALTGESDPDSSRHNWQMLRALLDESMAHNP
jgi:hypothetical protein